MAGWIPPRRSPWIEKSPQKFSNFWIEKNSNKHSININTYSINANACVWLAPVRSRRDGLIKQGQQAKPALRMNSKLRTATLVAAVTRAGRCEGRQIGWLCRGETSPTAGVSHPSLEVPRKRSRSFPTQMRK